MTQEIITGNCATWLLLLSLFVIVINNFAYEKKINFMFLCLIITLSLLDVSDILDFYLASLDTVNNWRYVSSSLGYVLRPLALVFISLILLRREKKNKLGWIFWTPLAVEAILIFTSYWSHWVFFFGDNNSFMRGPLSYLPHIMSAFYLLAVLLISFFFASIMDKGEVITICIISAFLFGAAMIETFTPYKFILTTTITVSVTMYFFYFYLRLSRMDSLTGLFSRQSFFASVDKIKGKSAVLVSVDLNGLKDLNDTQGHDKGDEALYTLASALIKAGGLSFTPFRTGGDEFIIVGEGKTLEDGQAYVAKAKKLLSATPYMAAFGLGLYNGKNSIQEALKKSDEAMYADKLTYKHR